ncbi:helicase DnaB [Streptococcus tangpeifui]|uniref:helicase DnaB n=1 Tax=Streptococcus tangpeifui TaxID=2709400 RepID=UPI0013EC0860|nr:helicase DnaB [Streptococcus sp. ZJ373]
MKPIDDFSFVKNNQVSRDMTNLIRLYLPIIGSDAAVVYQYLTSFYDGGGRIHKFAEILNHTLFDLPRFEAALAVLTGMDLVAFYQDLSNYIIELREPLTAQIFLANPVYRRLLESHIGDVAVAELEMEDISHLRNLSKKFSDVFSDKGEVELHPVQPKTNFDLESFKQRMTLDGLYFANEKQDVIALNNISEKFQLTWFDVYQLAKETSSHHKILPKRIVVKLRQGQESQSAAFSHEEEVILREAKASTPENFLAKVKTGLGAVTTTAKEKKILADLVEMDFLDEVINIMVVYYFKRNNSATLGRNAMMSLANIVSSKKAISAESALTVLSQHSQGYSKSKGQGAAKQTTSSVPDWSNPDYKEETSPEEQAKLDEMKRQMLQRLEKGGD